jgi:hypothetical protein
VIGTNEGGKPKNAGLAHGKSSVQLEAAPGEVHVRNFGLLGSVTNALQNSKWPISSEKAVL